jgi:hypothetical protein
MTYSTPITSEDQAHEFFRQLQQEGKLFHPEDDPEALDKVIFTQEEAVQIRHRLHEITRLDSDPCAWILENL